MHKKVKSLLGMLGLVLVSVLVYAEITVGFGPQIVTQPQSQSVMEGGSVTFSVAAKIYGNYTISLPGSVNLEMVGIEPGTFTMGSPTDELGREDNETQHEVTLTQGFWLGKYEVTQKQYQAVMGTKPSHFKGDNLPVEQVSWFDAKIFCTKLTELEKAAGRLPAGYEYTLPTEAQWEYVCRAGTTTALNSGENLSDVNSCSEMDAVGWYSGNASNTTHPVGQKQQNHWGLYDMHGNVAEWCLDYFEHYPTTAVVDPTGPSTGTINVVRGGAYNNSAHFDRSASRGSVVPANANMDTGFRVALAPSRGISVPLSGSVRMDMVWCPAGTFSMGSPTSELGRSSNETQHKVTLTSGFWVGKYEVTQAQYEAVMGTNPSSYKDEHNPLPVDSVSWRDATNFCARLTANEKSAGRLPKGYVYTLPSEAQWEYACRAGTGTGLNSGKNLTSTTTCAEMDEVGWYKANGGSKTHPVGQKLPNAWGIYDMHGNVWEWCWDWYDESYPTDEVVDPAGPGLPGSDTSRVYRGGSWDMNAQSCRSALRGYDQPSHGGNQCGFRVVLAKS
ncbi:MAG: formylglycine-generating enzyme family protein, partial [Verrucomicrobia bacterium]|nr:formylglycine-generating enzyme family protein [Verrucomicrobiota bacterium]